MHGIGNWCDIAIMVLWIVLMTNSFNLLDNSDGAAGSIAAVTAAALAVLAFEDRLGEHRRISSRRLGKLRWISDPQLGTSPHLHG